MQFCGLIAAHWALQFFRVQVHTSGQPVLKTRKSRTFSAKFFAMRHSSDFQNLETFWIGPICQGKSPATAGDANFGSIFQDYCCRWAIELMIELMIEP